MNNSTGLAVYSSKEYQELRVALMDDEYDDYTLRHRKRLLDDAFIYNADNSDLMCELSDCLCRAINELYK